MCRNCSPCCNIFGYCLANKRLDKCCFVLPLHAGTIILAALLIAVDIVLLALYTKRYHVDPFMDPETARQGPLPWLTGTESDVVPRAVKEGMRPLAELEPAVVLSLIVFFAMWTVFDSMLITAAIMRRFRPFMVVWTCVALVRLMHLPIDIALIIVTCLYAEDYDELLIPQYISLLSIPVLLYTRLVVSSFVQELREKELVERAVERRIHERESRSGLLKRFSTMISRRGTADVASHGGSGSTPRSPQSPPRGSAKPASDRATPPPVYPRLVKGGPDSGSSDDHAPAAPGANTAPASPRMTPQPASSTRSVVGRQSDLQAGENPLVIAKGASSHHFVEAMRA